MPHGSNGPRNSSGNPRRGRSNNLSSQPRQSQGLPQQRPAYCPANVELHPPGSQIPMFKTQTGNSVPSTQTMGESSSGGISMHQLHQMILETRDEIMEVKGENLALRQMVYSQNQHIASLERELDDLNQYGRRENVCFSNLKLDDGHTPEEQVIELAHEIGVEVKNEDFVDCHPLPTKKGNQVRVIARFKDRKLAQTLFKNRKNTKNIDNVKKESLACKKDKGFAIQPNITPRRAALLGQCIDAKQSCTFDSCWVDYKNGCILLRKTDKTRPYVITCTNDIVKILPAYKPRDYIFCCRPCDVFDVSYSDECPEE